MVSRENKVVVAFVAAALVLFFGGVAFTQIDRLVLTGILFLVGVITPLLINEYLDNEARA